MVGGVAVLKHCSALSSDPQASAVKCAHHSLPRVIDEKEAGGWTEKLGADLTKLVSKRTTFLQASLRHRHCTLESVNCKLFST